MCIFVWVCQRSLRDRSVGKVHLLVHRECTTIWSRWSKTDGGAATSGKIKTWKQVKIIILSELCELVKRIDNDRYTVTTPVKSHNAVTGLVWIVCSNFFKHFPPRWRRSGSRKPVPCTAEQNTFFMYSYLILTRWWCLTIGMNSVWTQDSKYQTTPCPKARFGSQHDYSRISRGFWRLRRCFDVLWCEAVVFWRWLRDKFFTALPRCDHRGHRRGVLKQVVCCVTV